ncbi:MAG TPA: hypothetical protein VLX12_01990 [Syntrophorhabdales bacterium]|nr:hypothetical protein [Syntrophorhabdales bacterium]
MKPITRSRVGLLPVIAVISVMAIFLSSTAGWADSLPDDPGKFNGLYWGQYLGELKGMRLVGYDPTKGGELYYVRQGDTAQMGGAKLEYVWYGFWRGVYSSVLFGTGGAENWQALRSMCFENFGPWHKPDWRIERYYWVGEHSAMTLEYNETLYEGQLYVYSKTIYERQLGEAGRGAAARRSVNRFSLY